MPRKDKLLKNNPKHWNKALENVPCFILGNGPSLNKWDLSILDNQFTVGINRIFYAYDPTILLWQDFALWSKEKKRVLASKAIKYCRVSSGDDKRFYTFKLEGKESRLSHNVSLIYGRGSSGPVAYQFVFALGCNPIILVGMDCRNDTKTGKTNFYGNNSMHRPHTLPYCVKGLKFIKKNRHNRTIINCSKNKVFENRVKLKEAVAKALEMSGGKTYSRDAIKKILKIKD